MALHLRLWGLSQVIDDAQVCMSEMVSNVINHVGAGTAAKLIVSVQDTLLRIEVQDIDSTACPAHLEVPEESESGRGLALIDALAARWGVDLLARGKSTWCELPTGLHTDDGHVTTVEVVRAEALLSHYMAERDPFTFARSRVTYRAAEEAAISAISDLLHWFHAHGRDADEALDWAQMHFDAALPHTSEGLRSS
jgi:hypothetical protein